MSLLTSLISHQIWLQRTASGEVKDLAPFIQEMRDEIKRQVLLFGDDGRSTSRLNKLLRDLEEALVGLTGDWQTKLTEDLKELAAYEAEWNVKTLTANVNAEFVTPTAEQVWAAAEFQPLSLSDKPVDFTKLMSGWGETEVARLVTGVKIGFVQGQTTRQIVKNVVGAGGLADISERNAATVIRTALSHVSNEARNETYRQNDDIIEKYEWVSTLDSRTSTTCFTAETELAPIAGMDAVMRGLYSGKIFTIELSNGEKFSGTPKHPVLTQYGWTPLDELDPTKHVLYTTVNKVTVLETVKNINMPARADYIFNTLANFPVRKMVSTSPAATDFYGDGVGLNGKIDIVRADCKLRNYVHASGIKQFKSEGFSLIHSAALLSDDSSGDFLLRGECPVSVPALSEAKCFDHRIENCFADLGPSYALNRRDAGLEQFYSPFLVQNGVVRNPTTGSVMHESELLEKCCYRGGSDAVILGYDAGGSAISVQRTNIIRISVEFRTCHVYTLSSSQGYYTAGSAIVKNCRARDGMTWEIGKGPMPPAHPNCLLGDTVVSTGSPVSNIFKRAYKGTIVYVSTKSGRTLSITPNHQVLTTRGWVASGLLNVGDKLVCAKDSALSLKHKEHNVVAKFSDLFSAANVAVNPAAVCTSPTTPEDFHGDGTDGEVEIVLVDRLSWDKVKSGLNKQIIDKELPVTAGVDDSLLGFGSTKQFGMVSLSPSDRFMRRGGESEALLGSSFSHSDEHSVAAAANGNAVLSENAYDWATRNADNLSDFNWSDAVGVELDDVVDLVFSEADFCGHVYNLENEQNWYLANGIIAHNCRSTTAPVISSEFNFLDKGAKRAAKGAEGGTQVSVDTTYYEFLKQQPAWFIDQALGPVRGKIFRNSGISPEEFRVISVDGFGNPLTLKQMAELDKRVADYLKGE